MPDAELLTTAFVTLYTFVVIWRVPVHSSKRAILFLRCWARVAITKDCICCLHTQH